MKKQNIFKKIDIFESRDCYINIKQFNIYDVIIPAYSIIYKNTSEKTLYICTRFPNYSGNPKNVLLSVVWYDWETRLLGQTVVKNCDVSITLFNAWVDANKPRAKRIVHQMNTRDYEKMMEHDHKKKRGTGGTRLTAKADEYTTDAIRYKQVTEIAYWEQLNDYHSGNASVVASSIR